MEILKVENLCKEYGSGDNKVQAIKNMNFTVEKGEFVCIVGASGSGKSTLLHLIGGMDKPTNGRVIIDGEDIYSLDDDKLSAFRRRKVGFIFQSYNLIPVLTAEENINITVLLDNKKPDKKYIDGLIDTLNLSNRKNHLPNELSGGQQQRVSIARALANNPSLILADEPTGNLDRKNSQEVMELLIATVKKFNKTLILITHDIEIANLADRVIKIEDGEIVSDEVIKYE
ncbi:MAG: ABC transporter ATP-binding protein [Clostridium sp.]